MILNNVLKSGKSKVIFLLICFIFFLFLVIDSGIRSQMMKMSEIDRLTTINQDWEKYKECLSKINVKEVTPDNIEVVLLSDIEACNSTSDKN